jgi:regulator of replication initiation timing
MELELLKKILEKLDQMDTRLNSLSDTVGSLSSEVNSLRSEMNERFEGVDLKLIQLHESVQRIETTQQEDILSVLGYINNKLEDTAKKTDVDNLRQDIEFTVKENSLFKLEIDRLKRNAYE